MEDNGGNGGQLTNCGGQNFLSSIFVPKKTKKYGGDGGQLSLSSIFIYMLCIVDMPGW